MKAAYYTLGCRVNQYDTAAMRELMEAAGFETVAFELDADVYIVNTCTVTSLAGAKSRKAISGALKRGRVIIAGCLQESAEPIPGCLYLGLNRLDIVSAAKSLLSGKQFTAERKTEHFERMRITKSDERVRAHIKITDGCNNFCTYCIVPYVRGASRSRPISDIAAEAERLASAGVSEAVITGINISSFGLDTGEEFCEMLTTVCGSGFERVRLGSLEPNLITKQFCEFCAELKNLCPHFHLSLQSGSDEILAAMGRKYTTAEYAEKVALLREYFTLPAITTDIIAGFPGETEEHHGQTLAFVRKIGFSRLHVFPYSKREGTAAAKMPNHINKTEKKRRAAELIALGERLAAEFESAVEPLKEEILVEQVKNGKAYGHTPRYIYQLTIDN